MKIISLFVAFFLIFSNTALSSKYKFDVYAWNKQDYQSKHMYVYGYLDGLSMANRLYLDSIRNNSSKTLLDPFSVYFGQTPKVVPKEEYLKNFGYQCSDQVSDYINNWLYSILSVSDLKQIIDGMNSFYSDYRNKKILVEDALNWVCQTLIGKTPEDVMQRMLEFLRANPKPDLF